MRADPDNLDEAPELAVLAVLDATLDQSILALIAQHRELVESDDLVGLPPVVWVADLLTSAARHLQHLLERYRLAALDDTRYRAHHPSVTPPPPRNFAE
jgi:hypothetical protein